MLNHVLIFFDKSLHVLIYVVNRKKSLHVLKRPCAYKKMSVLREGEVEKPDLRSKLSLFKIVKKNLLLKEAFSKCALLLIKNGCSIAFYNWI